MIEYDDLNNNEKRIIRETVGVERLSAFYLEDNNYLLMEGPDLFEYIYLCDIKKLKDAMNVIDLIKRTKIKENNINKTIEEALLENHDNVTKISNKVYLYKER